MRSVVQQWSICILFAGSEIAETTAELYVTPMLFEEKDLPAKIAEKQIYDYGKFFCDTSQGLE